MGAIDPDTPVRFLRTAFEANDAIGVLLKHYGSGHVVQRMVPVTTAASARFQAWLRHMNARAWNVYVTVNAYRPGRSRAREAVSTVRHLFLEEDRDGPALLAALSTRPDLPPASYVLHSSPGRVHVLWRVRDIPPSRIERLQKQLARELSTDRAATSCAQTTRLPGFVNHKRQPVVRVEIEYLRGRDVYSGVDLPDVPPIEKGASHVAPPPITSRRLADVSSEQRHFSRVSIRRSLASKAICGRSASAAGSCGDSRWPITRRSRLLRHGTRGVIRPGRGRTWRGRLRTPGNMAPNSKVVFYKAAHAYARIQISRVRDFAY